MSGEGGDAQVSYSVKELLQQLTERIDGFMNMMASKADAVSLAHALERIDKLDNRITQVEHYEQDRARHSSAATEFRRWVVPTLISLVTAAVLIFQVFHP